ncbi:MAG: helix-turn-helix domain-containing protein [Oscillibacter sp.]|nr:helix-turn-helix domain-containing protein [Oscillibacter sp.]
MGKQIRLLRMRQKLTQDELAEKLHVTRQTVSNYETGKSCPDVEMLAQIAAVFGTDVNALIYGPPKPTERKRELRAFFIALAVTAALGIAYDTGSPVTKKWMSDYFDMGPVIALRCILYPCFLLLFGRCTVQLAGLLGAKSLKGRFLTPLHCILLCLTAVYFLIMIPEIVELLAQSFAMWQAHQTHTEWTASTSVLPEWLAFLWNRMIKIPVSYPYLFFFVGAALWLTKGKEKTHEPQAQAPQSQTPQ